jgi:hypothetical protein
LGPALLYLLLNFKRSSVDFLAFGLKLDYLSVGVSDRFPQHPPI